MKEKFRMLITDETREKLIQIKKELKVSSFSKAIDEMIEKFKKINKGKLDFFEKKIDDRVESIHKRLGAYEKLYLNHIINIRDHIFEEKKIEEVSLSNSEEVENLKKEIVSLKKEMKNREDRAKTLKESYNKILSSEKSLIKTKNFFIHKMEKKKGIFSGLVYECSITEEEYKEYLSV